MHWELPKPQHMYAACQPPVGRPQPAVPDNEAACQQLQQRIEELEEELSCPITWQPMEDPVLLVASGQTFSRASIEEHWRRGHHRWVLGP